METSLRFGEFELFPERFELCRAGHTLRLERKPMEVLILLTEGNGRVLTRSEIAGHLWGSEVFVDTEHGINTAVRKLRLVLGDDPEKPRYVQTLPKLGYRFLAPVSTHPEPASLSAQPSATPPGTTSATSATSVPSASVLTRSLLEASVPADPLPATSLASSHSRGRLWPALGLLAAGLGISVAVLLRSPSYPSAPAVKYDQLTDLTDSAVAPALSPDGHTVAFIRSGSSFATGGPIFVKSLPIGEERLVTSDDRPKYGLVFSPDGSRIAYTVFGGDAFATYTVSVFGGDPTLLLKNAAGLSWLGSESILFSEIRSGIHLGVVTGTATGGATRDVYFPSHQRAMAHLSHASPDERWILVVEMDSTGHWAPCRVVAFNGPPRARIVGPEGACTASGWSADGRWMYFIASVAGQNHLWRQRFPDGAPQQITFGPAEEDSLAVDPVGNSVITSVGTTQSALWIHDDLGDRALSSEGEVLNENSPPQFRENDTVLYYLLRHRAGAAGAELRRVNAHSGKVDAVVPGVSVRDFDVSPDGKRVVFSAAGPAGDDLWLAPTDRSSLPARLGVQGASFPHFGPAGRILFQAPAGNVNYLEGIGSDGQGRSRLLPSPILEFQGVSPGGHWAMALVPAPGDSRHPALVAIPFDGSANRSICTSYCAPRWSSGGRSLFIPIADTSAAGSDAGQSLVLPVGPDERLPGLPLDGLSASLSSKEHGGWKLFGRGDLVPGKDPDHYAFVKRTVQRNLFRVTIR